MTATVPCWSILVFVGLSTSAPGQVDPRSFLDVASITDNNPGTNEFGRDNTAINSVSFKNQSLLTVGDFQFTSYYRDDGRLIVARRDLTSPTEVWELRVTAFTSFNINDSHNTSTIGIDGDGFVHVAWGTHGDNLLYTRSNTPLTAGQPLAFVGDAVGNGSAINTMTGTNETNTTYPSFFQIPGSGDLLVHYRNGSSGSGVQRIARYENATDSWSWASETWITNTHQGAGQGFNYNAYLQNLAYDSIGGLHATWTFRYNGSSPAGFSSYQTNHNLHYAYSPDDGVTWYKDLAGTEPYPAVIDEPGSQVIVAIAEGSSLINQASQAIDQNDRPAIATYWAPRSQDAEPDHRRQYMYVGHDGAGWFTSQITHRRSEDPGVRVPTSSLTTDRHMGRPQVVVDNYNRAYVVYSDYDNGGGVTVAYSQAASRDDWEFIELTDANLGYYEPTLDRSLWGRDQQLHLLTQSIDGDSANGGSVVQVLEWDAAQAMGRVIKWTGQSTSTWDGQSINFAELGAADSFDPFDNVTFDDASLSRDIQFAGDVQAGKVVVDSAHVYRFTGAGALTAGSLSVVGGGTLMLETSGNTYAGPTRVSNAALQITGDASSMRSRLIAADGGTILLDPSDAGSMTSDLEIWPTGTVIVGTATTAADVFPNTGVAIVNDGTLRVNEEETLSNMLGRGTLEAARETTRLTGNGGFDGKVIVQPGAAALALSTDGLGSPNAEVTVEAGGRLQFGAEGSFQQAFALNGSGGASMEVLPGRTATIASPLTGSTGFFKHGAGTLRLQGANSYSGATVVNEGTLVIDGATGVGDTAVGSGALLEAAGDVRGNLTAFSGSTIRVRTIDSVPLSPILFADSFDGNGQPLHGQSPDTTPHGDVWSAHSSINDHGLNISIAGGSSATLPFDVDDGQVYALEATFLNVESGTRAEWYGLGFVEGGMNGGTGNSNRFIGDPTSGKAWMIFRTDNSSFDNFTFVGSAASGTANSEAWPTLNTDGGDIDMKIVLDTTAGAGGYTAAFYAKPTDSVAYSLIRGPVALASEEIGAVGFAVSGDGGAGDIASFRLAREVAPLSAVSQFTVHGDFRLNQGATLELELFGDGDYERVAIIDTLVAAGSVSVVGDGARLAAGDVIDVLDFGALVGVFDRLLLPELSPGLAWDNADFLTDGVLRVEAALAGDFNGDLVVDAADYTVWRDSLGYVGAGLRADGNSDLHVDGLDSLVWKAQFGQHTTAAAAVGVPEPASVVLMVGALILSVAWIRAASPIQAFSIPTRVGTVTAGHPPSLTAWGIS